MFFREFVVAFIAAAVVVALFSLVLRRTGPWAGVGWFFLVVFLGAWAAGVWTTPVGPMAVGIAWLPFAMGALVLALLIAALSRPEPRSAPSSDLDRRADEGVEATLAVGAFFWVVVTLLVTLIVVGTALSV